MLRITDVRTSRIGRCVGPRAVCTFAGVAWTRYSCCMCKLLSTTSTSPGTMRAPAAWLQHRTRGAFLPPRDQHTPEGFPIQPCSIHFFYASSIPSYGLLRKTVLKRTRNAKHTRTQFPPTTRAFLHLAYESSQVRLHLRFHGWFFPFDLAAGSLALKFFGEYALAEATEGRHGHTEVDTNK